MKTLSFVFPFALFALAGCNVGNSIVGGDCREGFSEVNGACQRSSADSASASSPSNGFRGDIATPSAEEAGDPSDGPSSDPSVGGANGGPTGGSTGESNGVPSGGAGSATVSTSPDAGPDSGTLVCDATLVACHGECIPVANDAANCGACGKICPSNLCSYGECQGALAGDVIVLGHDYATSSSTSAQAKLIANALSIATTDPIRVLAFDGADPNAAAERTLIASTIRFRSVAYTIATDNDLEDTDLAKKFDVVLVHDAGPAASYLGARTNGSLESFTKKGGIVVAIDDGAGDVPAFLRDSGLLSMDGHVALTPEAQLEITAPNDALGAQVLSPYAPSGASVGFLGVQSSYDVTIVARTNDKAGLPTAIHRFVR